MGHLHPAQSGLFAVFVIVGMVFVFGSIAVGYTMHGGNLMVLMQISEFIIIGGAGMGALIVANPPHVVKEIFREIAGLLKPVPYRRREYQELLQVLYQLFYTARRDGLIGIEDHIENPEGSELFNQYPAFRAHSAAVRFLADTLKVLLTGAVEDHHLQEILDLDIDQYHDERMEIPHAIATIADAMPGFGIVAAVLGVIITMGKIGGEPAVIGESVAAALVGTFVGVLLAYGVVGPIATSIEQRMKAEHVYMLCIRTALLSFARGDSPLTSVEFARRSIHPEERPSFEEVEEMTRQKAA